MADIKPLDRKLGQKERKFIEYCERFYFLENYGFPTPEQAAVALQYSVTEIQFFLQNQTVQRALDKRGLPWQTAGAQGTELTPTQVAAAITVCNFADSRSEQVKLSELGVLPQQYYGWLNDPTFFKYVNDLANRNLKNVRPAAMTEFAKLVRSGDLNALKYYFEVTGEFKQQEVLNVQVVIQRLIESVQRWVKDPELLAAIANDMLSAAPVVAENVEVQIGGRQNVLTK